VTLLALALLAASVQAEPARRIFAAGDRAAAVYEDRVEFFLLPPETMATVGGRSAFGPLAENGMLLFWPELKPAKVLAFQKPVSKPARPERNAARFTLCADFCGVLDVSGKVVYKAPAAEGRTIDALGLSQDGKQAIFEYRRGNDLDSYLVWSEKTKAVKTYKADVRDLELRRTLNRFGLNDWNPEPEKKRKPEPSKP
jgi:hypothetical protein